MDNLYVICLGLIVPSSSKNRREEAKGTIFPIGFPCRNGSWIVPAQVSLTLSLLCGRIDCGNDSDLLDSRVHNHLCGDRTYVFTCALGSWHLTPSFGNAVTSIFISQASLASGYLLGFTFSTIATDGWEEAISLFRDVLSLPIASSLPFVFRSPQISRMLIWSLEKEGWCKKWLIGRRIMIWTCIDFHL